MLAGTRISRRRILKAAMGGAIVGTVLPRPGSGASLLADTPGADPRIQGPFLILSTPFTESGEVDFDVLAKEARFVNWCECPGMIWPQSGDSVDLLTTEEKLRGMEVLANEAKRFDSALCLGVQGKDTSEMLAFARHAEELAPTAIISRPPDSGRTQDDMRDYWRALAAVAKRPVFIQTTGGVAYRGPSPSVELLVELAREFPQFGYVKEEAGSVISRMRSLLAARPPVRRVFGARGGFGWLHELHLGAEGLITERAVYADVLTRVWKAHKSGSDPDAVRDAYSKFLLMANVAKTVPGGDLRGFQLYVWKKRGVFKNMVSRHYGPKRSIPASPRYSELKLSDHAVAEIDFRFEGLKPHMKPGSPDLGKPS